MDCRSRIAAGAKSGACSHLRGGWREGMRDREEMRDRERASLQPWPETLLPTSSTDPLWRTGPRQRTVGGQIESKTHGDCLSTSQTAAFPPLDAVPARDPPRTLCHPQPPF